MVAGAGEPEESLWRKTEQSRMQTSCSSAVFLASGAGGSDSSAREYSERVSATDWGMVPIHPPPPSSVHSSVWNKRKHAATSGVRSVLEVPTS